MDRQRPLLLARHRVTRRHALAVLLAAPLLAACRDDNPTGQAPVVLASPSAVANPPKEREPDMQALSIEVADGKFQNDSYEVRVGAVSLVVTAAGGPYTFEIEGLTQAREIAAGQGTTIEFHTQEAREYTMKLGGGGASDTAVLNVRPPGSR